MTTTLRTALLFALPLLFTTSTAIAVKAGGEFTATKSCPAYASKNKKTNPGHISIESGRNYRVLEINTAAARWLRIQVPGARPVARWVNHNCGRWLNASGAPGETPSAQACRTAGLADAYVLALSWQPAFCETHGKKPECRHPDRGHESRFTLHGLWPNRKQCGSGYGFCNQQRKKPGFCQYPPLELTVDTSRALARVMPASASGSCLHRYEWAKHGSCQTQWPAERYFSLAIKLTDQFNTQAITQFMGSNAGKTVAMAEFMGVLRRQFGDRAQNHVSLVCNRLNQLTEVRINLPATLAETGSLADYLGNAAAAGKNRSRCKSNFVIDRY